VTNNIKEVARIPQLKLENWLLHVSTSQYKKQGRFSLPIVTVEESKKYLNFLGEPR